MVDMDFSGPWGIDDATATPFFQSQIRLAWGGWSPDALIDRGVIATPATITATGTNTTITVRALSAVIRGMTVTLDSDTPLDVEDAGGTTPTSGQTRIDRIVIHLDFAAREAALMVSPGTPATSGAVAPTLVQEEELDGIWQYELGQVRRVGNVAVTTAMITNLGQALQAPTVYLPPGASPQAKLARGTITVTDTDIRLRRRTTSAINSLADKSLLDPDWTAANLATASWELLSTSRAFQWRIFGGLLQITGDAHRKAASGTIPDAWATVCTIPTTWIPAMRPGTWGHVSAGTNDGNPLSWLFTVPTTGSATLQVRSKFSASQSYANLPLFPIPVGV